MKTNFLEGELRVSPLPCCSRPLKERFRDVYTAISSDSFQLLQSYFVTYRKKTKKCDFCRLRVPA